MNRLEEKLKGRNLLLYGTGFVAEMALCAFEQQQLTDRIRGFLVSGVPAAQSFHGFPVFSAADYAFREDEVILLAVHDALVPEIRSFLERNGVRNERIPLYPYLYEMIYGLPVREETLPLAELLKAQPEEPLWIAVRYHAALSIRRDDRDGQELYLRLMSLHCGRNTAERRLENLKSLIRSVEEEGFRQTEPILVDEDLRIIDGLHRTAVCALYGVTEIRCAVVRRSGAYDRLLGDANRLEAGYLRAQGIGEETVGLLQRRKSEMTESASVPEISVVLPAYNVADYVDACMESLAGQTYRNFEAILINDGSADDTAKKCAEWAARDPRIRWVDQENQGVAAARNRGIREARGRFLAFIDPDDWVDRSYLEKLHTAAVAEEADFAECDLWRYDNRTGKKIYRACYGRMGIPYTREQHMKYGPTASYKAISRRALWTDNDVRFPSCSFESPAVYALILALANRIVSVREPLYWYRRFRENSLVETGYALAGGAANPTLGTEAMEHLVSEFLRLGLYPQYAETLEGVVKYRLNDILAMQFHRRRAEDFSVLTSNYEEFLKGMFPESCNSRYFVWGGYNLNRILSHMDLMQNPAWRFNFSAVPSVAFRSDQTTEVSHRNRYREIMVRREMDQQFWNLLEEIRPEFLIFDLMEERFDLLRWRDRFLTDSDAFEGAETDLSGYDRISRKDSVCTELWMESWNRFEEEIRKTVPGIRLIAVEDYLSETVGDPGNQKAFEDVEKIRETNRILKTYYDHLRGNERIRIIPAFEQELYFTDRNYEYGAVPSHLNGIVNEKIGKLVEKAIREAVEG